MNVRVRFAPSPTGNVHIGNIRVAIFNWLFARNTGGKFLLRVEDTDLERSTPEAIKNMIEAMAWLGLSYDEEPVYQTAQRQRHNAVVQELLAKGHASTAGEGEPVMLHLDATLFDKSFITEPKDGVTIKLEKGELHANCRCLLHIVQSSKGDTFTTPINWDAMDMPYFVFDDDTSAPAGEIASKVTAECAGDPKKTVDVRAMLEKPVKAIQFNRRYVYYDDAVLGRKEKPLDSLRDLVIVRSDGSPVFHLANVIDDIDMGISHILRGNDHVENTFRHLFIYKAIGAQPPVYGHFPMIVNDKGKPYSKRDGDAYVGDFRAKGYLPQVLFNFLALCGWSPGDGREIMSREEMCKDFSLDRINAAPAQLNLEKLEWMNGQYLSKMPVTELIPLIKEELANENIATGEINTEWLGKLVELEQERLLTIKEFIGNTRFFFAEKIELDEKSVKKVLLKKDGDGLKSLTAMLNILKNLNEWNASELETALGNYAEQNELGMGMIAQPLRVAITGGTVSRGIWETLELLGREKTLERINECLEQVEAPQPE